MLSQCSPVEYKHNGFIVMRQIFFILTLATITLCSCSKDNEYQVAEQEFTLHKGSEIYLSDNLKNPIDTIIIEDDLSRPCKLFTDNKTNVIKIEGLDMKFKENILFNDLMITYSDSKIKWIETYSSNSYFYFETINITQSEGDIFFEFKGNNQNYLFGYSNNKTSISMNAFISMSNKKTIKK